MFNPRSFRVLPAIFLLTTGIFGQFVTAAAPEPSVRVFPVSELREGMRGTAKSVFRGSVPEEFGVEILGVIPNWIGPKQDMIVGKLSGANAERTFVFAGMSGSPVYIDGRLVGAISYSFPFAKEPICGITPFEQMVSVVESPDTKVSSTATPRAVSYSDLLANTWRPDVSGRTATRSSLASGFSIDSPLMAIA